MKTKQILPIDLYLEYKKGRKEREAEICLIVYNIIMMYPLLMGAKLIGKIKRQIKEKQ